MLCSTPWRLESPTPDPKDSGSNVTVSPKQKEEQALMKAKKLANAVHYIWETGEDKYMLRYFHTGFWLSCEKHHGEGTCRPSLTCCKRNHFHFHNNSK